MQITKRQHYVWRYYLAQWTDKQTVEGKLFCCRNGKIFPSGLMNIGQENYFYKFIELSDADVFWIEKLCIYDNLPNELKQIDKMWLASYRYPFKLIEHLKANLGVRLVIDFCDNMEPDMVFDENGLYDNQKKLDVLAKYITDNPEKVEIQCRKIW